jgi:RHS repeat-associated protein
VGATPIQYLYEGLAIHAEYGADWTSPTAQSTHGPQLGTPLRRTTGTTTTPYHQDGLGSVTAASDATGAVTGLVFYTAWGTLLDGLGTVPRYGYTGREPDETGLVYYRARYYDPSLGRFTQRDPLGLVGGLNPYTYADANPTTWTDPLGLHTLTPEEAQGVAEINQYFASQLLQRLKNLTAGHFKTDEDYARY